MHKLVGRVVAICITVALAVVATSSANADSVNALVSGKVVRCGSPGHGTAHRACTLQRNAVVSAFNARHQLVATEKITNGHFSFFVKPGHYSLSARRPDGTSAGRPVVVKAHETKRTALVFNIGDFHHG